MLGSFGIIAGKLYYIGDSELAIKAAKNQKIEVIPEETTMEDYISEVEKMAIENLVLNYGGDAFKNTDNNVLGVELFDKTLANANKWKLITEVNNNSIVATYGTGWYFVESGTEVDGLGTLMKNYIIDYNNRLAIQFNAQKHSLMSYESTLAVTDHLIFNADPSVMEEYNSLSASEKANFDVSKLGEGIEFHGYYTDLDEDGIQDENEVTDLSQAFTATSFKFDGVDDYITFPYEESTNIENGFTYEFYGVINGQGKDYQDGVEVLEDTYDGIFCLWNGLEGMQASTRFGLDVSSKGVIDRLRFNLGISGLDGKNKSGFLANSTDLWNQYFRFRDYYKNLKVGDDISFSIVIDPENGIEKIFVDGEKRAEGFLNQTWWENYLEVYTSTYNKICFGRSSMSYDGFWHYIHSDVYSLRFYNRPLTDNEVRLNYNTVVSYHQFLENGGTAATGGDTGGESY